MVIELAGANGLAAPRDFQAPVAWYEDRAVNFTTHHKVILLAVSG